MNTKMLMFFSPYIAVISIALSLLTLVFILFCYKNYRQQQQLIGSKLQALQLLIDEYQLSASSQYQDVVKNTEHLQQNVLENNQVNKQLEHRIKNLQQEVHAYQERFQRLESLQPEDRLYSRASKLVTLGADVQEIMKECDLPLAEAQMLVAIHRKEHG